MNVDPTPPIVTWFRVYCGIAGVVIVAGLLGLLLLVLNDSSPDQDDALLGVAVFAVMAVPLLSVFGLGVFIPRRKWGWSAGIVIIAMGFSTPCTLPASIALMIFWARPECQQWFGRITPADTTSTAVFD